MPQISTSRPCSDQDSSASLNPHLWTPSVYLSPTPRFPDNLPQTPPLWDPVAIIHTKAASLFSIPEDLTHILTFGHHGFQSTSLNRAACRWASFAGRIQTTGYSAGDLSLSITHRALAITGIRSECINELAGIKQPHGIRESPRRSIGYARTSTSSSTFVAARGYILGWGNPQGISAADLPDCSAAPASNSMRTAFLPLGVSSSHSSQINDLTDAGNRKRSGLGRGRTRSCRTAPDPQVPNLSIFLLVFPFPNFSSGLPTLFAL
ncbi:hypothetical protein DFH09DRAFT_1096660 [Mycena vulgaris]|nr:hypothetical protein DFH09DRAFT_1096660 [Mycena vulgaris]